MPNIQNLAIAALIVSLMQNERKANEAEAEDRGVDVLIKQDACGEYAYHFEYKGETYSERGFATVDDVKAAARKKVVETRSDNCTCPECELRRSASFPH